MSDGNLPHDFNAPHLEEQLDELIEQFESEWAAGEPPAIADYLAQPEEIRLPLLSELVKVDLEHRWRFQQRSGQPRYLEEYLTEFPDLITHPNLLLEVIGEEYRVRQRWGDQPTHQEYIERYATLSSQQFRELFDRIDTDLRIDGKPNKPLAGIDASLPNLSLPNFSLPNLSLTDSPTTGESPTVLGSSFFDGDGGDSRQSTPAKNLDTDVEWISDFLVQTHPFTELPKGILQEIARRMTEQQFPAGTTMIRQGDDAGHILVLTDGIAEVSSIDDSQHSHLINRVGHHTVLGEIALLTQEPRSATVIATTEVHALALNVDDFHSIAKQFPSLNVIFAELVAERVGSIGLDVLCGKTLNGYRIERRLGRGNMGVIYEAIHLETERTVALKMMSHALIYDHHAVSRFHREAEIVESLDHPQIIRSYEKFTAFNTFFIVMEFCDGIPLSAAMERVPQFSEQQIRSLLGQLAAALNYAHNNHVIHRDLKPGNVFLKWNGDVKLIDFGLAKAETKTELTQHGQILGTPRYMPPEQLVGQPVGKEADLFALGCIIYELTTGKPIYSGTDLISLLRQQIDWKIPTITEFDCPVSPELYAVLTACLTMEPENRRVDLSAIAQWASPLDMKPFRKR